jgi:hypothetical protein
MELVTCSAGHPDKSGQQRQYRRLKRSSFTQNIRNKVEHVDYQLFLFLLIINVLIIK